MNKEVEEVLALLEKAIKGVHSRRGSAPNLQLKWLPTQIEPLDYILGGGLPYGRTILIKGDFSSGKTYICQKIMAAAQKQGKLCAFNDVEKTFEPIWFKTTGVDIDNLIVVQPGSGEEALDVSLALIEAGVDVVVLDSVAALVPTSELEGDMDNQQVGAIARLLNKGLRKIANANNGKSVFIILNQLRMGIGAAPFPTEALPGGKGQWSFSSIVLDVKRGAWITEGQGGPRIGFNMRLFTEKNKVNIPQQECILPFIFEGGVLDTARGLLDIALEIGIIKQKGAMYENVSFPEGRIRGKLNVIAFLQNNPEVSAVLQEKIKDADKNKRPTETSKDT